MSHSFVEFDVGVLDLFQFSKKIKKIGEKKVAGKCDFQATSHRNEKKILKIKISRTQKFQIKKTSRTNGFLTKNILESFRL